MTFRLTALLALLLLAACDKGLPPAEEAHEEGGEHVVLTDAQLQMAGITLATAGPAMIRETLPVYGTIVPNAERVREVGARFPGPIRSVAAKIGDEVRQGDVLARIESDESLQTYSVIAPISGTVVARNANPGEQSGERVLFTITDLSNVWVELALFPRDSGRVRTGQSVRVRSTDAGLTGEGRIVHVAPLGTSASQTLSARVLLDNTPRRWAPGLHVGADIALTQAEAAVAVRSEALQGWEGGTVVFVRGDEGFEPRPVRTGRTDGEHVEILEGLAAGETYAAANSFIVKSELGKGLAAHDH